MGKRRVANEAFLTPASVARDCAARVDRLFPLDDFARIVEPSAGDGVFLDVLPRDRTIGLDLHPLRNDVREQDFLTWQPAQEAGRTLVIGNPPFGQRGSLAMAFITHAATFAEVIAFILPGSFAKDTFVNRWPVHLHPCESVPVDEAFRIDGGSHRVRTVFQVWERRSAVRPRIRRAHDHPHFTMTHAHLSRTSDEERAHLRQTHAFALPQVGSRFTPRDLGTVVSGSHWFISPRSPHVRTVFEQLDFGFLAGLNTAHTSLARADIVQAYEEALAAKPDLRARIDADVLIRSER